MSEAKDTIAPKGQIWVCPGCGRKGEDRYALGDTSCVIHAVLCYEQPRPDGTYDAVPAKSGA